MKCSEVKCSEVQRREGVKAGCNGKDIQGVPGGMDNISGECSLC